MNKLDKILAVTALTGLAATSAMAETASDSVDATAGLKPALELRCTDVSFGVWRVPIRSAGGDTTITLDRDSNSASAAGNTTRVAQTHADASWTQSRGVCTLSGSTASDGQNATITIDGNADGTGGIRGFVSADADITGYAGLAGAGDATALSAYLNVPTSVVMTDGSATFYIGGVLTIPQNIIADYYGGYRTPHATAIAVHDAQELPSIVQQLPIKGLNP